MKVDRVKCVRISQAELVKLLIEHLGLPDGTKLFKDRIGFVVYEHVTNGMGVKLPPEEREFRFLVEHKSFDAVPEAQTVPSVFMVSCNPDAKSSKSRQKVPVT